MLLSHGLGCRWILGFLKGSLESIFVFEIEREELSWSKLVLVGDRDVCSDVQEVLADQVVSVSSSDMNRSVPEDLSLLVNVLTLSYQNSDNVKLTLRAGVPEIYITFGQNK